MLRITNEGCLQCSIYIYIYIGINQGCITPWVYIQKQTIDGITVHEKEVESRVRNYCFYFLGRYFASPLFSIEIFSKSTYYIISRNYNKAENVSY